MSLFPFLDTLVCTMGALILMLLAMTPKIKERALARQAAAQEAAAAAEPEAEIEPETPAWAPSGASEEERAAERERRRNAWLAQADEARNSLSDRQADLRRQRQQFRDAEQRLQDMQDQILKTRLKSENVSQSSDVLDQRAEKLEAQAAAVAQRIAATRKNIDLAGLRQAESKNEFALVAYDGVSGTTRRPIYIECTGRGFQFLPEGETVGAADLEGFSDGFNPLLAGAQSLIRFWARRKRTNGPAEPEPYVLLLVRPSGSFSFYVARQYLSTLGAHWGYELIEEDWKLSLPEPDPVAKQLLKETLAATVQIRRPHREVVSAERDKSRTFDPREFFEEDEGQGRSFGGGRGGRGDDLEFGGAGGRSGSGRPSIRQGYASRNDRSVGDPYPGDKPARDIDVAGVRNRGAGATGGAGGGNGKSAGGTAQPAGMGGAGRWGATTGGKTGGTGALGDGQGAPGDGEDPSATGVANAASGLRGRSTGKPAAFGAGTGGSNNDPSQDPEIGSTIRDPSEGDEENEGGIGTVAGGMASRSEAGRGGRGRARPASLGGGSSDSAENGDGGGGEQNQAGGIIGDGQPGNGSSADAGSSSADAGSSSAAEGTPSKPSWLSDAGDASSSTSRSAQMGGPGLNLSLGGKKSRKTTDPDNPDDGPRITENDGSRSKGGPPVRATGPRKWGQVGRKAGIGFEKKIKIYLNDKRIVVDSKQHMFLVTPADSADEIINHVANSIDQVAEGWGEPPSTFYWVPVVQFIVYPGGNTNYARLNTALEQKWGVTSTVEYAADRKEKKDNKSDKKAATGGRP
jgi:hypothetical protein